MTIAFQDATGLCIEAEMNALHFQYSPVWDVERREVLTYLCRAIVNDDSALPLQAMQFLLTEDSADQADLDIALLGECIHRLALNGPETSRVLIACPTHWSTLARSRSWSEFGSALHGLPAEILRNLTLCVHGVEADIPSVRIQSELGKLSSNLHGVFACLRYGDHSVERMKDVRVDGVGFVMPGADTDERAVSSRAREFCVIAEANRFNAFAFGVERRSVALGLIGAGYRYLEGSAIRRPVAAPRETFAHNTIDLFRADI